MTSSSRTAQDDDGSGQSVEAVLGEEFRDRVQGGKLSLVGHHRSVPLGVDWHLPAEPPVTRRSKTRRIHRTQDAIPPMHPGVGVACKDFRRQLMIQVSRCSTSYPIQGGGSRSQEWSSTRTPRAVKPPGYGPIPGFVRTARCFGMRTSRQGRHRFDSEIIPLFFGDVEFRS
jgi:hypothetical protein